MGMAGAVLIAPFAIKNFVQGRPLLGIGSLVTRSDVPTRPARKRIARGSRQAVAGSGLRPVHACGQPRDPSTLR